MKFQKVTLEEDWDVVEIEGHIELTSFDPRTNDFSLTMQRDGLHVVNRPQHLLDEDHFDKSWDWLTNYAIQSLTLGAQTIVPVWKPNRYGESADFNAFQKVTFTPAEIIIEVTAGGTEREVYERCNPYDDYATGQKKTKKYDDQFSEAEKSEADMEKIGDYLNKMLNPDDPSSSLFDHKK